MYIHYKLQTLHVDKMENHEHVMYENVLKYTQNAKASEHFNSQNIQEYWCM